MPYDHSERYGVDSAGVPYLERRYPNGEHDVLHGRQAIANANTQAALGWRAHNPMAAYRDSVPRPDAESESWLYRAGDSVRQMAESPEQSWYGKLFGKGPVAGAIVGGSTGLLGGILANWIAKGLGAKNPSFGLWGGLAGTALGALVGDERSKTASTREVDPMLMDILANAPSFQKSAAMFRDPRNFILEKLQSANDVSPMEKAQLAARVRNLDPVTASRLADAVRAALGFGVGAIIAKFLGGSALSGGFGGLLGMALFGTMLKKNPYVSSIF